LIGIVMMVTEWWWSMVMMMVDDDGWWWLKRQEGKRVREEGSSLLLGRSVRADRMCSIPTRQQNQNYTISTDRHRERNRQSTDRQREYVLPHSIEFDELERRQFSLSRLTSECHCHLAHLMMMMWWRRGSVSWLGCWWVGAYEKEGVGLFV
jgi:hypothetical protein